MPVSSRRKRRKALRILVVDDDPLQARLLKAHLERLEGVAVDAVPSGREALDSLVRRGDWFFPGWLENLTIPIMPSGYFCKAGSLETTQFKNVRVGVRPQNGSYPQFTVFCEADNGEYLSYRLLPYGHNQVVLERPQLRSRWWSLYNYNEYVFRTADITGRIGGKALDVRGMSPGYGNLEYTWGLGL